MRDTVNLMIQNGIHNNILEFATLFLNYSFTHRADKYLYVNVFLCAFVCADRQTKTCMCIQL